MINLSNLEPVKVSTDLSSYSSFIYGIPKIGKTTFVQSLYGQKVLFIATEKRHKVLAGAYVQYIGSWSEYMQVIAQLNTKAMHEKFDVICIDTVENLYDYLTATILAKYQEKEMGNADWGKDWTDLKKEWKKGLRIIERIGYTPCFISHAVQNTVKIPVAGVLESDVKENNMKKEEDKKTGEEYYTYDQYQPNLKDKVMSPINEMVDDILFMTNTIDTSGKEHRVIHLRSSLQWVAGSTFDNIAPVIPLSAQAYKNAVTAAIDKVDDSDKTDKKNTATLGEEKEIDFKALMKQTEDLGTKFFAANRGDEVTQIANEVFGTGNSIMDATPDQAELLQIAFNKMQSQFAKTLEQ
jgi:hypothetical protein